MIAALVRFFRTGDDRPVTMNEDDVARTDKRVRRNAFISLVLGYGFFYTCRLSLSVAKKPLIDSGILGPEQLGIIGAALFYTYAQGTTVHNFDAAIYFWRGASVLSMVFALLAWNLKARE